MIAPEQVVATARALKGTPYAHQGRVAGLAVDCIGVAVLVGRQLGLCDPQFDIRGYGRDPHDGLLMHLLDAALQRLSMPTLGALVLIRWFRRSEPQHCGIVADSPIAGELHLVHATGGDVGQCVEHRIDQKWRHRIVVAYALPGVAYPDELRIGERKPDFLGADHPVSQAKRLET